MPYTTIIFGVGLVLYGIMTFTRSETQSPTAAMPAYFGGALLVCGALAYCKESLRKHAMHVAALVGLVGLIGGLAMGAKHLPKLVAGDLANDPVTLNKAWAQNMLGLICGIYFIACVHSFVQARLARKKAAEATSPPNTK